jgi:hypothetical protein
MPSRSQIMMSCFMLQSEPIRLVFAGSQSTRDDDPKARFEPSLRLIVEQAVETVFGVETCQLQMAQRGPARVALARQTAMYLAHVGLSLSFTDVGILFQRDRTTVAHACAVIEDRRDDPHFDRALELLERVVQALHHGSMFGR